MAFLKIDSDQAFATAQKHGGDKILEKAPDTPVIYVCDWNHNTNELVWHVIYGAAREGAKLTVAVNASSGEFIRVERSSKSVLRTLRPQASPLYCHCVGGERMAITAGVRLMVRAFFAVDLGFDLGKEAVQGLGRSDGSRNARRSPNATMSCGEYWRRTRSAAQCALNNSTLAAARSALRRAISICFLVPDTIIYNSSDSLWG
jgi:hypothetical protein